MSESRGQKRKKKKWNYTGSSKKMHGLRNLEPGMKGFMVSCNMAEQRALKEAYNLLNEYADRLYGPELFGERVEQDSNEDSDEREGSGDEEEDMEKALQKEVSAMKMKSPQERRFLGVKTGVNNCLFIRTTLEAPEQLAELIYKEIFDTQVAKSRHIMRFLPILGTCKASEENIEKLAHEVLAPYFNREAGLQSYIIRFKVRNNNGIGRDTVIPLVGDVVGELNGQTYVKSEDPDFVIMIDILKTICCISLLKEFEKYKKYNLQEIVKIKTSEVGKSTLADVKDASGATPGKDQPTESVASAENRKEQVVEEAQSVDRDSQAKETLEDGKSEEAAVETAHVSEQPQTNDI